MGLFKKIIGHLWTAVDPEVGIVAAAMLIMILISAVILFANLIR